MIPTMGIPVVSSSSSLLSLFVSFAYDMSYGEQNIVTHASSQTGFFTNIYSEPLLFRLEKALYNK
jgi:hypothetical protein